MFKNLIIKCGLGVILLFLSISLNAQDYLLKGKVLNTSKEPISNIAINYEGSVESPVISDSTGTFELNVPSGEEWLSISSLGDFKSKKVYLNNRKEITIYLVKQDQNSVYDEVVLARTDMQKRNLISSIFSTTNEKLSQNSFESFDQSLHGRTGGMYQVGMSGMPGAGTYMLIRGLNSINTSNQPLILVDGMPLENPGIFQSVVDGYSINPSNSIDQMDISSLSVVKSGNALTSYGAKGSNGLIIIETLKPADTETSIDFSYKTGVSLADKELPQLNPNAYKTLAKEVLSTTRYLQEDYKDLYPGLFFIPDDKEYIRYNHNTNWQKEVFSDSWMQDFYVSVKGGDAIARYGLSVGYLGHNGIIKNTDFNRFSTRFVGTFNVFSWLKMYVSANLVSSNSAFKESSLNEQTSPILTALQKSPQLNPFAYDDEGDKLERIDQVEELGVSNPAAVINGYDAKNTSYRFLTSFRIEGSITKNLTWNTLVGLNINDLKETVFMPNQGMETYYDNEAYNVSKASNNILNTFYNDNYLNYNNVFNNVHNLKVMGGVRWQTNEFQNDVGIAMNSNENDQYTNLGAGDNQLRNVTGENYKWTWLSNYYTVNYVYRDKYLFEAALSADFSSRVGKSADGLLKIKNEPVGLFYNVGAAWRISNESFMSDVSAVEDLKLRVTYGTSGNDNIGNLNALRYYTLKLYRETSGMIPGENANEELKFETTNQLDVGIDFSVMENRLNFSADYYQATTNDVLIYDPLPSYLGDRVYPSNNASIDKNGYEFSLVARLIQNRNFAFDVGLSIGHYSSKIASISNNKIVNVMPGGIEIVNQTGEAVNSFYGYQYKGVFATTQDANSAGLVNETGIPYRAGDARFKDLNGDKIINELDKTIIGSANPDYFGGITTALYYKRWKLDVLWQYSLGQELFNYLRYKNESMLDLSNQSTAVLNRWVNEGQKTEVPHAVWGDPVGNADFSSRWVEDGSFLRLKNVTLAYQIPENVWLFKNLSVFVTGSNLLTFTNYLSFDPEFSNSYRPPVQGIDYGLMPLSKRFIVGVKFGL